MDYSLIFDTAVEIGYQLAMHGAETYRIEESINRITAAYGAKAEVFAAVNGAMQKHNVPLFLMENILSEALYQVREGAKAEIQNATDSYQKQMDEFNKTTE